MELPGYEIGKVIGDGGMATVYHATQLSLQRPVAIKVLKHTLVDEEIIRQRFVRESLIIARLNHPNIVHVIDQGITESGQPYFVMEYVKSISLDRAMQATDVSLQRKLDIFIQIAKALGYAHRNGVIHRDVKPANILVDYEGHVQMLDFGIARLFDEEQEVASADKQQVMGTFDYMAPELQISAANACPQSDLYAFGLVMYQFVTGRLPKDSIVPPSEFNGSLPTALDQLIVKCLDQNPNRRPESADEIKQQLLLISKGGHLRSEQRQRAREGVKKDFSLLDVLRETKYGATYLFEEVTQQRLFVIKKLPAKSAGYEACQFLAQLKHPNIVKVLGTSKNERVFITVMEYLPGGTLADRLTHVFSDAEFLRIALQILEAISFAHQKGLVHGNLRPSNILFASGNHIKVVDFGLQAHYVNNPDEINWYTLKPNKAADYAADQYALGVIFYQMLTGDLPNRTTVEELPQYHFSAVPETFRPIIEKMLQVKPQDRYSKTALILSEFRDRQGKQQTVVEDVKKPGQVATARGGGTWKKWAAGFVLLGFIALQAYGLYSGQLQSLIRQLLERF